MKKIRIIETLVKIGIKADLTGFKYIQHCIMQSHEGIKLGMPVRKGTSGPHLVQPVTRKNFRTISLIQMIIPTEICWGYCIGG